MSMPTITPADLGIGSIPLPKRRDWRIGLIGYGGIARSQHAPAYRKQSWNVVAVADPSPSAQEAARSELPEARLYESLECLISDPGVEVVALLTQPTIRIAPIQAAAAAGKPILVEKPMALTLTEAEEIVRIAETSISLVAVSQNYRWATGAFLASQMVRAGMIGKPFLASITLHGDQDEQLGDHPYYATCEDFLTVQWNTHLFDIIRGFLGADPVRSFTRTARMRGQRFISDNLLISVMDFGDGVTGHILHSELMRGRERVDEFRIDGPDGTIIGGLYGGDLRFSLRRFDFEPRVLDYTGMDIPTSFAGSMGDLLLSIEEGREPQVSARRNLATIRHVLDEQSAAKAGGRWFES